MYITAKLLDFGSSQSPCCVWPGGCASCARGHPAPWFVARAVLAEHKFTLVVWEFWLPHLYNEANTTHHKRHISDTVLYIVTRKQFYFLIKFLFLLSTVLYKLSKYFIYIFENFWALSFNGFPTKVISPYFTTTKLICLIDMHHFSLWINNKCDMIHLMRRRVNYTTLLTVHY